jgi:hypothetical protein
MNYLELVNDVLVRLREDEVNSVSQNAYSKMIGKFVIDAQRQVEDSYNWNSLSNTLTMTTVSGLFNGVLVGSGQRFRVIDVINDTSNWFMEYKPTLAMDDAFLNGANGGATGSPKYYNFNGFKNGDTQVDIYPIPDGVYTLRFNIIQPQDPLVNASDELMVPDEPVIFLAYAKAIAERGEDGGLAASEAYALYRQSLADHIAIEANRYPEETIWDFS